MLLLITIASLVASVTCQHVAFSAGLTQNMTLLHAETVLYDKVYANVGNGYDPSTGDFTAPVAGNYAFQFHTLAHESKSAWLELYKNDDYIASIYGHTVNDYASGGNSVVLTLAVGDKVHIKAVDNSYGYDTNLYGAPNEVYSTFSGYLVAAQGG